MTLPSFAVGATGVLTHIRLHPNSTRNILKLKSRSPVHAHITPVTT